MVVDNVAGMGGGGLSFQDVVLATVANNTVANNDSTATAGAAFVTPAPAGPVAVLGTVVALVLAAGLAGPVLRPAAALSAPSAATSPRLRRRQALCRR